MHRRERAPYRVVAAESGLRSARRRCSPAEGTRIARIVLLSPLLMCTQNRLRAVFRFTLLLVKAFSLSLQTWCRVSLLTATVADGFKGALRMVWKSLICMKAPFVTESDRLEAFSDGVIAIIITVMVLEMKVPLPHQGATLADLKPVVPSFLKLCVELRLHRHLLEQPPSHAPRDARHRRPRYVGKSPFALLAIARAVHDELVR